jgi:hypothetical protein
MGNSGSEVKQSDSNNLMNNRDNWNNTDNRDDCHPNMNATRTCIRRDYYRLGMGCSLVGSNQGYGNDQLKPPEKVELVAGLKSVHVARETDSKPDCSFLRLDWIPGFAREGLERSVMENFQVRLDK